LAKLPARLIDSFSFLLFTGSALAVSLELRQANFGSNQPPSGAINALACDGPHVPGSYS
jgi:hypothetical protein